MPEVYMIFARKKFSGIFFFLGKGRGEGGGRGKGAANAPC